MIQISQQTKVIEFSQVQTVQDYDGPAGTDGVVAQVYIRMDKSYDEYSRQVGDLLALLGNIGGLREALFGIVGLFVSYLSQKIFMSAIVKKIYMFRNYDNIKHELRNKSIRENGPRGEDD